MFGVWAPGEEVAKLTYFGLYALQHRGQESAGIATSDGSQVLVYKDMGLVSQVFSDSLLESLHGHIAIGHARYSTTGSSVWENAQPTFRATATGHLALGHNGNLTNTHELSERLASMDTGELPLDSTVIATTDTDLITALLAAHAGAPVEALQTMLSLYGYGTGIDGVYSEKTEGDVSAFQRHFRPERVDGIADFSTIDTLHRLLSALPRLTA